MPKTLTHRETESESERSQKYKKPKYSLERDIMQRDREKENVEREIRFVIEGGETNPRRQSGLYHHQNTVPSTDIVSVFCTKG